MNISSVNGKCNKMKGKNYLLIGTILKSNIKILERGKINILNTQIHDRSLSLLDTSTPIKSGGIILVLWVQTFN